MRPDRVHLRAEGRLATQPSGRALSYGPRKGEVMATARVACHVPATGNVLPTKDGGRLFVRILTFGEVARALLECSKGDRITFEGPIGENVFQGRDGEVRRSVECTASRVMMDGPVVGEEAGPDAPPAPGAAAAPKPPATDPYGDWGGEVEMTPEEREELEEWLAHGEPGTQPPVPESLRKLQAEQGV